ncbi:MAG: o-succinylbenzoate synthase [Cyanobacteriota bacterium]|nr:o-succinylbenzoate synthase [Cyanobacteriota bacterium]
MSAAASVAADGSPGEPVTLQWRPFHFALPAPLRTAAGRLERRRGWLLRLQTARETVGWGEAAPLALGSAPDGALAACALELEELAGRWSRGDLEERLPGLPPALAFAVGAALAEADGLVGAGAGGWRPPPPSAHLLPAGPDALETVQALRKVWDSARGQGAGLGTNSLPPTVKWKVAVHPERVEQACYERLIRLLPGGTRLRLDANGGFDRATAERWVDLLRREERLQWLEQPLAPADQDGLEALALRVPIALDESLLLRPDLRRNWRGWQVRRPSQEGDPRPLLRELGAGRPRWMVSTSFETGIGRRWLAHLAALQAEGPTPVAPGLAPGWRAPGDLGAEAPEAVWRAALAG